jgi:outer membrane murein-binding lipoprotein Lpp
MFNVYMSRLLTMTNADEDQDKGPMKITLISLAVAGCILSAIGCTTVVRDDALQMRVSDLEKRVATLEAKQNK